jgi:hypothetical protein
MSDRIGCGRSLVCAFILEIAGLLSRLRGFAGFKGYK